MKLHVQKGITLIELMVTLAVFAVLVGIGAPSLVGLSQTNRHITQINSLVADLALARNEAVTRNTTINVSSNNGLDWSQGWQVSVATSGVVLQTTPALPTGLTLDANIAQVSYRGDGTQATGNTVVTLCEYGKSGSYGRQININATGRLILNEGQACP